MKKTLIIFAALSFSAFAASAQTKKDGTPDMRYRANQQAYSNTYPTPAPTYSAPSNSSSETNYSGNTHTESHGGNYQGTEPGAGSSHRGGTYQNVNTGSRYGRHKSTF